MARRVNLDDLLGEPQVITFKSEEYQLPAEVPLDTIAELVRLQEKLASDDEDADTIALMEQMRQKVLAIFREENPDCGDFRVGMEGLSRTLAIILGGSGEEDFAALVAEQIGGPESANGHAEEGDPLPSPKPSRKRSSRSAA